MKEGSKMADFMKFMKGTYIVFFIILIIAIFSSFSAESSIANPFDYARITEVDYKAVVVDEPNSNGKVIITERLTFDIHAASEDNLFWELWRDLPESYIDGVKVEYKVNSVKQIFDDKTEQVYTESSKLYWYDSDYTNTLGGYGPGKWYHSKGPYDEEYDRYECVFFYVDGLYREKVVFEIEYEMTNAALRYNDSSELYLTLYSEDTIKYLEAFKGQILFPLEDMPSEGNYEAYTYGTNSHSFPFTESSTINPGYHTFMFELDKSQLKFRPYNEYIEFALIAFGEDKHIFTEYASKNYYYFDDVLDELREEQDKYEEEPEKYKKIKTYVLIAAIFGTALLGLYTYRKDKKMRNKYNFYEPTMPFEYYRDIPSNLDPYFAAALVSCKHKPISNDANGYSAIMLSLIRKDYIALEKINPLMDWTSNNIKIIVKYKPVQPTMLSQPTLQNQLGQQVPQSTTLGTTIPQPTPVVQPTTLGTTIPQPTPVVQPPTQNTIATTQNLEALTKTEEYYFNLIVRHSSKEGLPMETFQNNVALDYEYTNTFVKNMDNAVLDIGISQGYFQKSDYEYPKKLVKATSKKFMITGIILLTLVNYMSYLTRLDFAFGAFFILGLGFIISSIYLNKLAKKYILLTQFGEDEYAKWRGLYNFLNSDTLMNERTVIELPLWEQYLVYATAFGISEKVIKALQIRCPNIEMSPILSNPYYRSVNFRYNGSTFRSATRSASHYSRSSFGSYGGHYGGGGRGGGGGGGGH